MHCLLCKLYCNLQALDHIHSKRRNILGRSSKEERKRKLSMIYFQKLVFRRIQMRLKIILKYTLTHPFSLIFIYLVQLSKKRWSEELRDIPDLPYYSFSMYLIATFSCGFILLLSIMFDCLYIIVWIPEELLCLMLVWSQKILVFRNYISREVLW